MRTLSQLHPIGHVKFPMMAAFAIHRRLNRLNSHLAGHPILVFADESGDVFAVRSDSNKALFLRPHEIIGTYIRGVYPADISSDIEAWAEEA